MLTKAQFLMVCRDTGNAKRKPSQKSKRSESTNRAIQHEEPQRKKTRSETNTIAHDKSKKQSKEKTIEVFGKDINTNAWYKSEFYKRICDLDNLSATTTDQGHVDVNFVLTPSERIGKKSFKNRKIYFSFIY